MKITHLIVLVGTDDGKFRAADLSGKQPKQVKGFVTHIQGGTLRLRTEPTWKVIDFVNPDGSLKETVSHD